MKYARYFLLVILAAIFLAWLFFSSGNERVAENQGALPAAGAPSGPAVPRSWETRRDERGWVTVSVTPLEMDAGAGAWKFRIVLDTHAGSLDDDLLDTVLLLDGADGTYRPVAWEGPGPGGHHREGILVFDSIRFAPDLVTLAVKEVGGVPERFFEWKRGE